MISILSVTGPIYIVIGVGYIAARLGAFDKTDGQSLGRFVMNFALPAMLFNALASRNFQDVINPNYFAAYALGSLVSFTLMFMFARQILNKGTTCAALMALGSSSSNSGYIGYPILLQVLGPTAAIGLALTVLIENLLMIPIGICIAEVGQAQHNNWRHSLLESLRRLIKIPLIWAILLGFCFSMLGWHLPDIAEKTVSMFSATCAGAALFVNGGALFGLQVKGLARQVSGIALTKLIVHPCSVVFFLWAFGPIVAPLEITAIILASMPMMGIYPLLAQRFHMEGFCAAALLVTTLLSFVTISLLLWLLQTIPELASWLK
jgi:predicted permease